MVPSTTAARPAQLAAYSISTFRPQRKARPARSSSSSQTNLHWKLRRTTTAATVSSSSPCSTGRLVLRPLLPHPRRSLRTTDLSRWLLATPTISLPFLVQRAKRSEFGSIRLEMVFLTTFRTTIPAVSIFVGPGGVVLIVARSYRPVCCAEVMKVMMAQEHAQGLGRSGTRTWPVWLLRLEDPGFLGQDFDICVDF